MLSDDLIKLIFGLIGAVIGFVVKDYLDRKRDIEVQRISDRREHYKTLLLCLKSLSEGNRESEAVLKYEYAFLWLYAPDKVVRCCNKLIQQLNTQPYGINVIEEVGELLLEMRKDLGRRRTKLSVNNFEIVGKKTTPAA
jgi:hypothetical protein